MSKIIPQYTKTWKRYLKRSRNVPSISSQAYIIIDEIFSEMLHFSKKHEDFCLKYWGILLFGFDAFSLYIFNFLKILVVEDLWPEISMAQGLVL